MRASLQSPGVVDRFVEDREGIQERGGNGVGVKHTRGPHRECSIPAPPTMPTRDMPRLWFVTSERACVKGKEERMGECVSVSSLRAVWCECERGVRGGGGVWCQCRHLLFAARPEGGWATRAHDGLRGFYRRQKTAVRESCDQKS